MSTHRQTVKTPNMERARPVTASVQNHQSVQPGIHESSFLSGPCELRLGPPRSPPLAPTNVEAGSSRRAHRTQFINGRSGGLDIIDEQIIGSRREIVTPFRLELGRPIVPLGPRGQNGYLRLFLPMHHPSGSLTLGPTNGDVDVDDDDDDPIMLSPASYQQLHVEPVAPLPSPPPPPPPPPVPTYTCPICLCTMSEESTVTKCGHVFCDRCIRKAITAQAKCPDQRTEQTHPGPAASLVRGFDQVRLPVK
ncbi:hypothetical protein E3N88_36367 [Mikania micrantha]|uniref:RING-type domain-containing protein n=1 Tax=Mikania micrantha TaxID=192012 RepID=A0A5N6M3N9_9ASTR|nr:hypothetical protein E3N88_36367 [Mikania micrantha]